MKQKDHEAFHGGREAFHGGREAFHGGREAFHGGREAKNLGHGAINNFLMAINLPYYESFIQQTIWDRIMRE